MRSITLRAINAILKKRGIKARFIGPELIAIHNIKIQIRKNHARLILIMPLYKKATASAQLVATFYGFIPPYIDIMEINRIDLADPDFTNQLVKAIANAGPQAYKP